MTYGSVIILGTYTAITNNHCCLLSHIFSSFDTMQSSECLQKISENLININVKIHNYNNYYLSFEILNRW